MSLVYATRCDGVGCKRLKGGGEKGWMRNAITEQDWCPTCAPSAPDVYTLQRIHSEQEARKK